MCRYIQKLLNLMIWDVYKLLESINNLNYRSFDHLNLSHKLLEISLNYLKF